MNIDELDVPGEDDPKDLKALLKESDEIRERGRLLLQALRSVMDEPNEDSGVSDDEQ